MIHCWNVNIFAPPNLKDVFDWLIDLYHVIKCLFLLSVIAVFFMTWLLFVYFRLKFLKGFLLVGSEFLCLGRTWPTFKTHRCMSTTRIRCSAVWVNRQPCVCLDNSLFSKYKNLNTLIFKVDDRPLRNLSIFTIVICIDFAVRLWSVHITFHFYEALSFTLKTAIVIIISSLVLWPN